MAHPNCDGSHCRVSTGPVRVLPVTPGGSNLILCQACHEHEMRWRRQRNAELAPDARFATPEWATLPVYDTDETFCACGRVVSECDGSRKGCSSRSR